MSAVACLFANLRDQDEQTYMEKLIIFHAKQIQYKVKVAKILTFRNEYKNAYKNYSVYALPILEMMHLKSFIISKNQEYFTVFIYDEELLNAILKNKQVKNCLKCYANYPMLSTVEEYLLFLQKRFITQACPDEIGIFLGYPVEDVISYIQKEGREFLCCKHWKVYHNMDKSLALFAEIDTVCEKVANMLLPCNLEYKKLLAI